MTEQQAAVKLRTAAAEWAAYLPVVPRDQHDREGQRLNRRLLRAARVYARVTKPLPQKPRKGRKCQHTVAQARYISDSGTAMGYYCVDCNEPVEFVNQ